MLVEIIRFGCVVIRYSSGIFWYAKQEGYGIGDDEYSLAYDGCRNLIWYEAQCSPHPLQQWKPGDVLGCLLDIGNQEAVFSLNGVPLPANRQLFNIAKSEWIYL